MEPALSLADRFLIGIAAAAAAIILFFAWKETRRP